MVALVETLVLVLLTLLCVWRIRQSPMYRNRRRWGGGVPGQWTRPTPTPVSSRMKRIWLMSFNHAGSIPVMP